MKKMLLSIFLIVMCILSTGCQNVNTKNQDNIEPKYVESEIIKNLKNTVRIDIIEEKIIGTITDGNAINELIDIISNSSFLDTVCLTDVHQMELEMYDENDNLLSTIEFWPSVERIRPENSANKCYFNVQGENTIKNIIERETDYKF